MECTPGVQARRPGASGANKAWQCDEFWHIDAVWIREAKWDPQTECPQTSRGFNEASDKKVFDHDKTGAGSKRKAESDSRHALS